ncbi:MAG: ATP-binding protein [Elusimicrobiota bacterium]
MNNTTTTIAENLKDMGLFLIPGMYGRLRRELIWTIGKQRMDSTMARIGLSIGQNESVKWEESSFLKSLATMDSKGMVQSLAERTIEFSFSLEANEHETFFGPKAISTQCWLLAGYLTGSISRTIKRPIYFLETECKAKGDPVCQFLGRMKQDWELDGDADLSIFEEDNMALELNAMMEQLKQTKDRYQNLFEQSSLALFIMDPNTGVFLNANLAAEELTGYNRDQLIQMNIFDLLESKEHQKVINELRNLMTEGKSKDYEVSILRKDGTIRIIARSDKVLSYGGQKVIQTIMRDITDLKVSEQKEKDLHFQLMRSERLSSIGRLAASVAHELKNPLGAIRNAIYYIRGSVGNSDLMEKDPQLKEILKLSEDEIDSAVLIIGELLDFSRVVKLVPRKTQINSLLERIPIIINIPEGITLNMDLDITLPSAFIDPDRLNQVFCNIVSNGIQAMQNKGKLTIQTRLSVESSGEEGPTFEWLVVTFEDTGSGIDPIHLTKIFEPLFTTKVRGTGLGLAISNNIIEKHGGKILVTSQLGKGSRFTIKLPLQAPSDKEEINNESE